jgi:hypothetical protein
MNPKHIFYAIYAVILLHSCKPSDKSLYEFDPRSLYQNEITLSEIADDINYIPLDNSFQLGLIYDNIVFINNAIFLSEKDVGILVFNKEGKIIRKIGGVGRGPGEYVYSYNFTVDEKTETVYIRDSGDIIKVYSKTGKFLRNFWLKEYGDGIDAIKSFNSRLFVSFEIQNKNVKYKWAIVDSLGDLIKTQVNKIPPFTSDVTRFVVPYIFENRLTYWNSHFTDTVFSIFPDLSEQPLFLISPGEHRYPKSQIIYPNEVNKYLSILQIFETKRFLAIRYIYNKNDFVLIDKANNKSFLANWEFDGSGGIFNDIDDGTSFLPKDYFTESKGEYLFGYLYPYQLKSIVASNKFKTTTPKYPEKKKKLVKLADSLKETDNPVLMIVKLKK